MDDTFRQDSNSDEEAAASDILKLDYDHDDDVHKRKLDVLNLDEHQSEHDRAAGSPDRPKKLSASRPPTAATGGRLRVDEHFWLEEGNVILLVRYHPVTINIQYCEGTLFPILSRSMILISK